MATANIDLKDGTKILIQGTPEEIARVIALYNSGRASPPAEMGSAINTRVKSPAARKNGRRQASGRPRAGAMQHIRELIHEGFFTERQSIANVQAKLEEAGRIYPQTHLSTPLRRLVVNKELRRLRDGSNWAYVDA